MCHGHKAGFELLRKTIDVMIMIDQHQLDQIDGVAGVTELLCNSVLHAVRMLSRSSSFNRSTMYIFQFIFCRFFTARPL